TGAYGLVRHPMYTAVLAMMLATGLAWSHWIGLAAGLALAWIGTIIRTRIEDRLLRAAFGPEFDAYARGVPALIPRWAPKASTNRRPPSRSSS
ncbi:MAG: isoprenylcysteine carboxylmethyltransferase family protein, partial [Acidobacteriota bacterium]